MWLQVGKTIIPEAAMSSLLYSQELKNSVSEEDAESLFFKVVEIDVSLKRMNLDLWAALLKRKEESKPETNKIDEEMHMLMKLTEQISLAMDEILMEDCLDVQKQMLLQLFLAIREAAYRLQQLQHRIHDLAVCESNSAAAFKKAQLDIAKRMGEMISLFNPTHGEKELNQTHPTV